jgi:ATP-dependent Clp protease adaptor protein ClpS
MEGNNHIQENPFTHELIDNDSLGNNSLVLHNDDVHTFDYVIDSLIEVCDHDTVQAEQCAYIVHYKGKCDVKKGEMETLRPLKNMLVDKGLQATID